MKRILIKAMVPETSEVLHSVVKHFETAPKHLYVARIEDGCSSREVRDYVEALKMIAGPNGIAMVVTREVKIEVFELEEEELADV